MRTKPTDRSLLWAVIVVSTAVVATAQAPTPQGGAPGGGRGGAPRLVLSVTSTGWPDGGEVPMRHAGRGDNKSPAFEFHWSLGTNPAAAPEGLQTYAAQDHSITTCSSSTRWTPSWICRPPRRETIC